MRLNHWLSGLFPRHRFVDPSIRRRLKKRRAVQKNWGTTSGVASYVSPLESRVLLSATTIEVTTFCDVVDEGDGVTSLREAVIEANQSNNPDGVEISLAAGTYELSITGIGEDAALTGDLDIYGGAGTISIIGAGANQTTIDGKSIDRIFDVFSGNSLAIEGVTLTGGTAAGNYGGAIRNYGNLKVTASTLSGNTATYYGGGIYNANGTAEITGSTLSGNTANYGGGIYNYYYSTAEITGSTLSGNTANYYGGGIHNDTNSTAEITGSTLSGNTAYSGGGIFNDNGTAEITGSTLSGNTATYYGGGIYNYNGTAEITGSTLVENTASGFGGGILSQYGILTVTESTVADNIAATSGGGGIYSTNNVTISGSTISGNTAGWGAGIQIGSTGNLTLTGSTISGNTSNGALGGGGIYVSSTSTGSIQIAHSTITQNRSQAVGGGIRNDSGNTVTLSHSLVAGNYLGTAGTTPNEVSGILGGTSSFNLIGHEATAGGLANGSNGNIVGVNWTTVLDPTLADNGGPTLTHALIAGGLAHNAGNPSFNNPNLTNDQRGVGFSRVFGGRIDIGAFEIQPTLEEQITAATSGSTLQFSIPNDAELASFLNKLATVTSPHAETVTLQLNLASGSYTGKSITVPNGLKLVLNGSAGSVVFSGASPALTVNNGEVVVESGITFTNDTDSSTIVVASGGKLTLDDTIVHETSGGSQSAILVESGGFLDVSSGNNIFKVQGFGQLITWQGTGNLNITGNTLQVDSTTLSSEVQADNFQIEDLITHTMDIASYGRVLWADNDTVYVTTNTLGIQRGVNLATAGGTVLVADGTYVENVVLNKNVNLLSQNGRGSTTIQGVGGTALGTVLVTNGAVVQIGDTGQGFKIIGIDNNSAGVESAALYFQGNFTGAEVYDNEIVANGDGGLISEYGVAVSNFIISGNEFSGKTFAGAQPAGSGFGAAQFSTPNVPRQLVVIGNGNGDAATAKATNITFTNNIITGTAGGVNANGEEQGNTLVTIDAANSTITGNTFAGTTTRDGVALRVRRPGTTISGNTFTSTNMGIGTGHLFVQGSVGDYVADNTFDRGSYVQSGTTISTSITGGIGRAGFGSTLKVLAGTYNENVLINKAGLTVSGAGSDAGGSKIVGRDDVANGSTVRIGANNVTLEGFQITRDGNTVAEWAANQNLGGVAVQDITGATIRNNVITGNRTGIDINNSNNINVYQNDIVDNRTGMILRNAVQGSQIYQNNITDNWTLGVVWLGPDFNPGVATGTAFYNNNISGNWYGQVETRDVDGTIKNFSGNWFGTTDVTVSTVTAVDPPYNTHIPEEFGGTSTRPVAAQPTIRATDPNLIDIGPYLASGTDTNGGPGFQGDFSHLYVTALGGQTGTGGRINEAIGLVSGASPQVTVTSGTYNEDVLINKNNLTLNSVSGAATTIINGQLSGSGERAAIITGNNVQNLTLGGVGRGLTVKASTSGQSDALYLNSGNSGHTIEGNIFVSSHTSGQNSAVEAEAKQSNHVFRGNTFSGTATQLVYIGGQASHGAPNASSNVDFLNNVFSGVGSLLLGQEASDSEISGNTFTGAASSAALRIYGNNVVTANNTLTGTGTGTGIDVDGSYDGGIANVTLTNNAVSGYAQGGNIKNVTTATINTTDSVETVRVNVKANNSIAEGVLSVHNKLQEISYSDVGELKVNTLDGNDVVHVAAHSSTVVTLDGGPHTSSTADTLNYYAGGAAHSVQSDKIETAGKATINYAAFEKVTLTAGTANLVIHGTGGDDTLEITTTGASSGRYRLIVDGVEGPEISFSNINSLTFHGFAGDDILRITNTSSTRFAPAGGVHFEGGAEANDVANNPPGDRLEILGGSAASIDHVFTDAGTGSVFYNGVTHGITFTGLEGPTLDNVTATTRYVSFAGDDETITVAADSSATSRTVVTSTLGNGVTFKPATNTGHTTNIRTNEHGGSGDDTVFFQGLGVGFGSVLNVDLSEDNVVFDGAVTLGKSFNLTGANDVDFGSNSLSLTATGTANITASGDVTFGSGGSLTTNTGAINVTTGGAISMAADSVISSTSSDINLTAAGDVTVTGISASTKKVTITSTGGSIKDAGEGVVDITSSQALLKAAKGVEDLELSVAALEGVAGAEGFTITNSGKNLAIGSVDGGTAGISTTNGNISITVEGGNLTVSEALDSGTGAIDLRTATSGIVVATGQLTGGDITVDSIGTVNLSGGVTAGGDLSVTSVGTATISNNVSAGDVTVNVTGTGAAAINGVLTVDSLTVKTTTANSSSTGNVAFNASSQVTASGTVEIDSAGRSDFNGTITAGELDVESNGNVTFSNAVNVDSLTVATGTAYTNANATVTFGSASVVKSKAVDSPAPDVTINTLGSVTFKGQLKADDVTVTSGTSTNFDGTIALPTKADVTSLTVTAGGIVSFDEDSTVNASGAIDLKAGTGTSAFRGVIQSESFDLDTDGLFNFYAGSEVETGEMNVTAIGVGTSYFSGDLDVDSLEVTTTAPGDGSATRNVTFSTGSSVNATEDVTISVAGNATVNGAIDVDSLTVTTTASTSNSTGNVAFGSNSSVDAAGDVAVDSAGTAKLEGTIDADGIMDVQSVGTSTIGKTVTLGEVEGTDSLSVKTTTGNVVFAAGSSVDTGAGDITVQSAGTATFSGNIEAGDLDVDTAGAATFNLSVDVDSLDVKTTSGSVTFAAASTVNAGTGDITIVSAGSATFSGSIAGGDFDVDVKSAATFNHSVNVKSLNVKSDTGAVSFAAASNVTTVNDIDVDSGSTASLAGTVTTGGDLNVKAVGTVTTGGTTTVNEDLTITTAGTATVGGTITAEDLTVDVTGTGTAGFTGAINADSLNVTTALSTSSSTGNISFSTTSVVNVNEDVTIDSAGLTGLTGNLTATGDLTIDTVGTATIGGTVKVDELTVNVTGTGSANFSGALNADSLAVTTASSTSSSTGNVSFASTSNVDITTDVDIDAAGTVSFASELSAKSLNAVAAKGVTLSALTAISATDGVSMEAETGELSMTDGATITVSSGDVDLKGATNARISSVTATSGNVSVKSVTGSVLSIGTGTNITADSVNIESGATIGTSSKSLSLAVSELTAKAAGVLYIANQGDLEVHQADSTGTLGEVSITATGELNVVGTVESKGTRDVTLTSQQGVTLEIGSDVTAGRRLYVNGGGDGTGHSINLLGKVTSAQSPVITGGAGDDVIVLNPEAGSSNIQFQLAGGSGSDEYVIHVGNLPGGAQISESAASGDDHLILIGTNAADAFSVHRNATPGTGGYITHTPDSKSVTHSENLESLSIRGRDGDDSINVVSSSISSLLFDGGEGSDSYQIALGQLNSAVEISDSGEAGTDEAIVIGTPAADSFVIQNNATPETGGSVTLVNGDPLVVSYTESLELLNVLGGNGADTFHVQPSLSTTITLNGESPVIGPGADDYPQVDGDAIDLDPLGNFFQITPTSLLVDGGYKAIHYSGMEGLPLAPQGETTWRFDFNAGSGITQSGYTAVERTRIYGNGQEGADFGWVGSSPTVAFDRGAVVGGEIEDLLRDGHLDSATRTFRADVTDGWYLVSIKIGDQQTARDKIRIVNPENGQVLLDNVSSAAGEFVTATFVVQATNGTLSFTISDEGGANTMWVLNALEIRPAELLTIGMEQVGTLVADGVSQHTFEIFNVTPGAKVTVRAGLDTDGDGIADFPVQVVTPDASPELAGAQIKADSNGRYFVTIVSPAGKGTVLLQLEEVSGDKTGLGAVNFESPSIRRFDFNTPTSPTQTPVAADGPDASGYTSTLPTTIYSDGLGYGWLTATVGIDRGNLTPDEPQEDLRRDGHIGSVSRTFRTQLAAGTYWVNVTMGDHQTTRDKMQIFVNGSATPAVEGLTAPAGQFVTAGFLVTVGADGILDLTFADAGGDNAIWVINGLEIRPESAATQIGFSVTGDPDVPADGVSTQVITGSASGLTDGTLVTITSSLGTILGADVSTQYVGHQVAVVGGQFQFTIQAPTGAGIPTFTAKAVDGSAFGESSNLIEFVFNEAALSWSYDFNSGASPTQAGYTGVLPTTAYNSSLGYGWVGTAPVGFNRTIAVTDGIDLLRDGHMGGAGVAGRRTFRVDLAPSTPYSVTVTLGDGQTSRDFMEIRDAAGNILVNNINTAAGQFVNVTFVATTDANGALQLQFGDSGGNANWTVNGLVIRNTVTSLNVTPPSSGELQADGVSTDLFSICGLTPLATYTLKSITGTIVSIGENPVSDSSSVYAGLQFVATSTTMQIGVARPASIGTLTLSVEQLNGEAFGYASQDYVPSSVQRYDFNGTAQDTAEGFVGVSASTLFSQGLGHGWLTAPTAFQRTTASQTPSLYRDGALGGAGAAGARTFQIAVAPSGTYDVRIYTGDYNAARDQLRITVEGVVGTPVNTGANEFITVLFEGITDDGDGILNITFQDMGGSANWSVNGVEIAEVSAQLTFAGPAGAGAESVTQADANEILAAAISRMDDPSLFAGVTVQIVDFGTKGTLGATAGNVIYIDNDAFGHGWYIDADPNSDDEFDTVVDGDPAFGKVDLLTVLMHHLGRIAGENPIDELSSNWMSNQLGINTRRVP